MKTHATTRMFAMAILAAVWLTLAGCTSAMTGRPQAAPAEAKPAAPAPETQMATAPAKGGAQLWAETCSRCHNLRPPNWRTPADREAAVHHMAVRLPLTGEDQRAIIEFLTSVR